MRSNLRHRPLLLVAALALGWSLACSMGNDVAEDDAMPSFDFAAPRQIVVVPGDSLSLIAERESCTVDEIRQWNYLETDVIEPGQILLVWETGGAGRVVPKDGSDRQPKVAAAPKPAPRGWNPLRKLVGSEEPVAEPVPVAAAVDPDDGLAAAPDPEDDGPERPLLVRGAGILGVDLGGSDDGELERSAAGMERRDLDMDGSGLKGRGGGLDGGGSADSFEVDARQPGNYGGVQIPNTPVSAPRLARPAAKRCLSGPKESDLQGDNDAVTNAGLTSAQIQAGMAKVVRASPACFPRGTSGTYSLVVELNVGCDGIVDTVRTISAGVVPSHVTQCVETTMAYAGFAAHGRPAGVVFQYPLEYTF